VREKEDTLCISLRLGKEMFLYLKQHQEKEVKVNVIDSELSALPLPPRTSCLSNHGVIFAFVFGIFLVLVIEQRGH
jgi:hypothetical protein